MLALFAKGQWTLTKTLNTFIAFVAASAMFSTCNLKRKIMKVDMKEIQIANELQGLRKVIEYLWAGEPAAFNVLYFIKENYKEWAAIIKWLKDNNIRGKKLVELFQNESSDGGGYHMGVTYILSRIKGHKNTVVGVKLDELK